MTERLQIYKCEICGNIVEMLQGGKGELICCGQPMKLFKENTIDASVEKHVPVVSREGSNINVKVGSVAHPMEESHYIQWIEVVSGDKAYRRFLKAGEAPEADFCIEGKDMTVREYCNIHGLWKS